MARGEVAEQGGGGELGAPERADAPRGDAGRGQRQQVEEHRLAQQRHIGVLLVQPLEVEREPDTDEGGLRSGEHTEADGADVEAEG